MPIFRRRFIERPRSSGVDATIVPSLGRTVWNPGIYEGIPTDSSSGRADGAGGATQQGATIAAGASAATIQTRLNEAGAAATLSARKFVKLGAGLFSIGSQLQIPAYVVLRGTMNADGFTRDTVLRQSSDFGEVITIAPNALSGNWGTVRSISPATAKDDATITVNDASNFAVGDIITIDQVSASIGSAGGSLPASTTPSGSNWMWWGDHTWFVRQKYTGDGSYEGRFPDTSTTPGYRHVSEMHQVLSKNGNVLTVYDSNASVIKGSPCRLPMHATPQCYRAAGSHTDVIRYAGVEDLKIEPLSTQGRTCLSINQAAFCWLKNVESHGDNPNTAFNLAVHLHVLEQVYRCEITGCYFHGFDTYGPGGSYAVRFSGCECYFHNNVVMKATKPFIFENDGGGNVVAYNYFDYGWHGVTETWQEYVLGSHAAFSAYNLLEGNWTPNMGPDSTHGNNGWWTMFRNYARGRNTGNGQTGPQRCVSPGGWQRNMYSIGNVLGDPALTWDTQIDDKRVQSGAGPDRAPYLTGWAAWYIGNPGAGYQIGDWDNGETFNNFHRHLDYDAFSASQYDNPSNSVKTLQNSLHRTTAPSYFTSGGYTWPWVVPSAGTHATRVLTLPAKARFDAGQA